LEEARGECAHTRTRKRALTPQRKCWWDGVEVDVPRSSTSKETMKVKVWARRVWTLELSLVSKVLGFWIGVGVSVGARERERIAEKGLVMCSG
jgi:ABC-type dipeptide/oligopeptide/nickel transport system permease component